MEQFPSIIIDLGNCKICGMALSANGCYDCFPEKDPTQPHARLTIKNGKIGFGCCSQCGAFDYQCECKLQIQNGN